MQGADTEQWTGCAVPLRYISCCILARGLRKWFHRTLKPRPPPHLLQHGVAVGALQHARAHNDQWPLRALQPLEVVAAGWEAGWRKGEAGQHNNNT